jgi:hypothetical protein
MRCVTAALACLAEAHKCSAMDVLRVLNACTMQNREGLEGSLCEYEKRHKANFLQRKHDIVQERTGARSAGSVCRHRSQGVLRRLWVEKQASNLRQTANKTFRAAFSFQHAILAC